MIKSYLKYKQQTKKTLLTPTTTEKTLILTKKVRNYLYAVLGVISITLVFSFEFFENWSEEVVVARTEHKKKKEISNKNLKQVKKYAKGTEVGDRYFKSKAETDKAWDELKKIKENSKVFGFTWWQQFMGEFGPWCAFFLFAFFHLIRSHIREPKNKGLILFNLSFVTATIFFLIWVFQPAPDYPRIAYYGITILCGIIVYFGVWLLAKKHNNRLVQWKKKFFEMAKFSFVHTKEESKEKMLNKIEDLCSEK